MLPQGEENEVLHGCNKKTMKYRRGRVKIKRATHGSWKYVTALMNISRVIAKNKRVGRLCWVFCTQIRTIYIRAKKLSCRLEMEEEVNGKRANARPLQ